MHARKRIPGAAMVLAAGLVIGACEQVPHAHFVSLSSPDGERAAAALSRWPNPSGDEPLRRPFLFTLHAGGRKILGGGTLEYYRPRDFRFMAASDQGTPLFDARMNWAGIAVHQSPPGTDHRLAQIIVRDISRALEPPAKIDGLRAGDEKMIMQRRSGDGHEFTWIFDRESGRLQQTTVVYGALDSLEMDYRSYNALGWPQEIDLSRPGQLYELSLNFTDNVVVKGTQAPGAQGAGGGGE